MWPFSCSVLVLDDDALFRDSIQLQLTEAGCRSLTAERVEDAVALLESDETIGVVLIDKPAVDVTTRTVVDLLHQVRPEAMIVGNSGADRREEYTEAGVARYLQKPWRVGDLVGMVVDRIMRCASCGIGLPLRRPGPGESGESWACASCGCRYRAVYFDDAPANVLRNACKPD